MNTASLRVNPAFRALIPPLRPDEFAGLERSIIAEGCRDALVVWNGVLLDGHNRYSICTAHGLPFKTLEVEFPDKDRAELWVRFNQLGRRNLTDDQRAMLADEAAELESKLVRSEQARDAANIRHGNRSCVSDAPSKTHQTKDTRAKAAKAAKVSERKLKKARKVRKKSKKLRDQIIAGETTLAAAEREIKQAERETARREAIAACPQINSQIFVGDFRHQFDKVVDGTISLIFTDPPYDRESEKLFPALADFAAAKLADGGSLIFYAGHLQLPAAFQAFNGKLRHWWTCACLHGGDKALMREFGIRVRWKPMLWFVKGTRQDKTAILFDTVTGDKEKDLHDWQQRQSDAEYYISGLCPADGIVCDPFLGSGTTAAAAKALGRKWIGFEIDPATAAVATNRLAP